MATAQSIINRATRLLGVLQPNTDLGANQSADALVALNAMQDGMRNDVGLCYAYQDESLTMVNGTNPYTIGTGGSLNTNRPVSIEDAYIVASNYSYYVRIIEDDEYDSIPAKLTQSSWPDRINYRPTMPTGTLYTYPVSNGTSAVLHLRTRVVLTAFVLTDTIILPPGWEDMLAFNLAIALAPEYETQPSPVVMKAATDTKAAIKRLNLRPVKGSTGLPALVGGLRSNIFTNQP